MVWQGVGKKENEVTIITLNDKKEYEIQWDNGIRIIKVPGIDAFEGRLPLIRFNKAFRKFCKTLKKSSLIWWLSRQDITLYLSFGARYAKMKNIPCILLDHSTAHVHIGGNLVNKMFAAYEHVMTKILKSLGCRFFWRFSGLQQMVGAFSYFSPGCFI